MSFRTKEKRMCSKEIEELEKLKQQAAKEVEQKIIEERVNHPKHYNHGNIEAIDYIEDCLGTQGCVDFCIGNVIKYIARAGHKSINRLEDYKKAVWYLQKAINLEETGIPQLIEVETWEVD